MLDRGATSDWKPRLLMFAVLAAAVALLPNAAKADTYATYDLTGTFVSGGSLSGQITLDLTTGKFYTDNGPISADGLNFVCPSSVTLPCVAGASFPGTIGFVSIQNPGGSPLTYLVLTWSQTGWSFPMSSAPSVITFVSAPGSYCKNCLAGITFDTLESGTAALDPVPEPATLGLLATGLVGLGLTRRRRFQA